MQGAKCKILHIYTCASTKILSRPNFMILFLHHLLPARCKVQALAHLQRCKFYVLIKTQFLHHPHLQGANCKILHICTRASIKFLSSPNYPYLQGAKCKILHICTRASIKFLSSPNFYIIPTCKVQSARSCTFAHMHVISYYLAPISTSSLLARCKVQDLAQLHTCK